MKKNNIKKIASGILLFSIGIVLIIVLVVRIDNQEWIPAFLKFSVKAFFLIAGTTLVAALIGNWRGKLILKSQNEDVPFRKLMNIWLAGNAVNYSTPFVFIGGEGVRAYLLKERFGVSWRKSTSFILFDKLLDISAALVVVLAVAAAFVLHSGLGGITKAILSIFIAAAIASVLLFLMYFQIFRNKQIATPVLRFLKLHKTRLGRFLNKVESDMIGFVDKKSKVMWYGWGLSLVKQVVLIFRHIMLIYFLGRGVQLMASSLGLVALYAGYAFPVPGALGAQEVLQSAVFSVFGFGAGEGLAASLFLRATDLLVIGLGVIVLLQFGLRMVIKNAANMLQLNGDNK